MVRYMIYQIPVIIIMVTRYLIYQVPVIIIMARYLICQIPVIMIMVKILYIPDTSYIQCFDLILCTILSRCPY